MEYPNYVKFIELLKAEHPIGAEHITVAGDFYRCGYVSCNKCPYSFEESCITSRQNDFPQSLDYHRKTYPEDFV